MPNQDGSSEKMKPFGRKIQDSDWPFPPKRMNVAEETAPPVSHAQDDPTGYPYPSEGV